MKLKRMFAVALALMVAGTTLLAGCTSGSQTNAPTVSRTLKLNLGTEPPSLDSAKATDSASFVVLQNTQEGLVRRGEGGDLAKGSGLARDWEISPDGLVYTFYLKAGLKWSDGQPLQAKDLAYAWERALDPSTASSYAYQLYYIKGAQALNELNVNAPDFAAKYEELRGNLGIATPDDLTLKVTLAHPTPYFLGMTAFPTYLPVRADLVKQHGDTFAADAAKQAYSGPFLIKEWSHETSITLAKNPNYWDAGQVQIDQVSFLMVKDANTALNLFDSGELDQVGVPGDFIPIYKDKGLQSMTDAATFYITLNVEKNAALKNPKVRRALSLALDRQQFVTSVAKNGSLAALALVPPGIDGPTPDQGFRAFAGNFLLGNSDPEQAKSLLAEGLRELGLSAPPQLKLLVSDSSVSKRYTQGVQEMWKRNLGLDVQLDVVSFAVLLERARGGNFDMVFSGWVGDYNDSMTFLDLFLSQGEFNDSGWSNSEYDQLIRRAQASGQQDQRMRDLAQAEKILMQELPILPLYHSTSNWVQKPNLSGILRFNVGGSTDLKWARLG